MNIFRSSIDLVECKGEIVQQWEIASYIIEMMAAVQRAVCVWKQAMVLQSSPCKCIMFPTSTSSYLIVM